MSVGVRLRTLNALNYIIIVKAGLGSSSPTEGYRDPLFLVRRDPRSWNPGRSSWNPGRSWDQELYRVGACEGDMSGNAPALGGSSRILDRVEPERGDPSIEFIYHAWYTIWRIYRERENPQGETENKIYIFN